jgi:hypothetical protein
MQELTVFYSWQSDLPNRTNRGLIRDALDAAVAALKEEGSLVVEPRVEQDTQGVPGAPDIGHTIFEKIAGSSVFVCDVSFVSAEPARPSPNPNVLVELGFALSKLGWSRIVMVFNSAFGVVEELPFDLRQKRALVYASGEDDQERASARKDLSRKLQDALRLILQQQPKRTQELAPPSLAERAVAEIREGDPGAPATVQDFMGEIAKAAAQASPKTPDGNLFIRALEAQDKLVESFAVVSDEIARRGDAQSAGSLHRGFGALLQQYALPPRQGGHFYRSDFDLPKFLGHELFTSFAALLLKRGRARLLGDVLREPLYVGDVNNNGVRSFARLSDQVALVRNYYEGRGNNYLSPQGELLKARHASQSRLASLVPWDAFMGADLFLYLFSVTADGRSSGQWVPWSYLYLRESGVPEWLGRARSRRVLIELSALFGLSEEEFKKKYAEFIGKPERFFDGGLPFPPDFPSASVLGSVP